MQVPLKATKGSLPFPSLPFVFVNSMEFFGSPSRTAVTVVMGTVQLAAALNWCRTCNRLRCRRSKAPAGELTTLSEPALRCASVCPHCCVQVCAARSRWWRLKAHVKGASERRSLMLTRN